MTIVERLFEGQLWNPTTLLGAVSYLVVFILVAMMLNRFVQRVIAQMMKQDIHERIDRTVLSFLQPLSRIAIFAVSLTLYAHIIPALAKVGSALLAGVSISAVIIGLAAQNTLGNLIAGVALLLYRPLNVGERIQLTTPAGIDTGIVLSITLGYTILQTDNHKQIIVPNNVMANNVILKTADLNG